MAGPGAVRSILDNVQYLDGSEVATLRWINERAVLRTLIDSDQDRSVTDIARACNLSRPTVEGALAQLIDDDWVIESPPRTSGNGAGRPAKRYEFADHSRVVVGVDLGPHNVVCSVATMRGEELATFRISDLDLTGGQDALDAMQDCLRIALGEAGTTAERIIALTVGLPAIVSSAGDIGLTVVVPAWQEFRLSQRIRDAFPTADVLFENDAKLATAAEHAWGSATGVTSAVNVIVGRRVAAGVISEGRLLRGTHGGAGEIGAFSATRWDGVYDRLAGDAGSIEETFANAAAGGADARQRLHHFILDLAQGVAALCLVIDPEVVVIGGGVAQLGDRLLRPLRDAVNELTLFPVELRASSLGHSAVARGGVALSRDHVARSVLRIT